MFSLLSHGAMPDYCSTSGTSPQPHTAPYHILHPLCVVFAVARAYAGARVACNDGWLACCPPQVASSARCSSRPRSRPTCSSLPPSRRRVSRRRYRNLRPRRWEPKGEGPCPHHLGTEALRHRALSAADSLLGPGPERCLGRFSSRPGRARRAACRATAPCSRCRPCASRATPAPATRLSAQARRRAYVVNYWAAAGRRDSLPGCSKVGSIWGAMHGDGGRQSCGRGSLSEESSWRPCALNPPRVPGHATSLRRLHRRWPTRYFFCSAAMDSRAARSRPSSSRFRSPCGAPARVGRASQTAEMQECRAGHSELLG